MPFVEPPPQQIPPTVKRLDEDGKPTKEQLDYESRLREWLKRLAASIP
jgi:hypothetical protein